jgi:hypothetical protein
MPVKALVGAVALALSAPAPLVTGPSEYYPQVKQVICDDSKGSAVLVEGGKYVTAAHVTDGVNCKIDGMPITATPEPGLDFATIPAPASKQRGFRINCEGFKAGQWVHVVGYAKGWPWQTMQLLLATYKKDTDGKRVIFGFPTFIPGQSGGLVAQDGAITGIVNSYIPGMPFSFSRELKDTSLCRGAGAIA